jgi:GcrA cell cycle regulator
LCKWPIGDPVSDSFRFCGRRSLPKEAYCAEHYRIAFQSRPSQRNASTRGKPGPVAADLEIEVRRRIGH